MSASAAVVVTGAVMPGEPPRGSAKRPEPLSARNCRIPRALMPAHSARQTRCVFPAAKRETRSQIPGEMLSVRVPGRSVVPVPDEPALPRAIVGT